MKQMPDWMYQLEAHTMNGTLLTDELIDKYKDDPRMNNE
jgi:hypothetical protein